jgi:cardiolipin synthase
VGDEYMGKSKFGFWRDTHVRVEGPAAMHAQLSFSEDWFWSSGKVPDLKWDMNSTLTDGKAVLVLPTGPADGLDSCSLFFQEAIHAAKKRIWITSPYFVPDQAVISALQLAAMRGVDVRIILPNQADHFLVYWASFSYLKDTLPFNIKLYRYQKGFIHQKALLVDDGLSSIGTANFDNRSFKLNFEITMVFADTEFSKTVETMLLEDFSHCKKS